MIVLQVLPAFFAGQERGTQSQVTLSRQKLTDTWKEFPC